MLAAPLCRRGTATIHVKDGPGLWGWGAEEETRAVLIWERARLRYQFFAQSKNDHLVTMRLPSRGASFCFRGQEIQAAERAVDGSEAGLKKSSPLQEPFTGRGCSLFVCGCPPRQSPCTAPVPPNLSPNPRGPGKLKTSRKIKAKSTQSLSERPTWRFALRCDPPRQEFVFCARILRSGIQAARGWARQAPVGFSPLHPIGGFEAAPRYS